MFRHKPTRKYCGLTIVLGQPSRNDLNGLISGTADWFFNEKCLQPETNRYCCDVRLADDNSPLLDDTKVILLLGAKAHAKFGNNLITTLDEQRGSPYYHNGIPCIASYAPQDAIDLKDWESRYHEGQEEDEESQDEVFAEKGKGKTSRNNYRFWLRNDTKKALRILKNEGKLPFSYLAEPNYHICSDPDIINNKLLLPKGDVLFFDMETDFITYDMRCFAFSFLSDPFNIFVVPWLNTEYKPYYGFKTQAAIWLALKRAVHFNTLVAHNGSQFDYLVLANRYKIPINRVFDTLVCQHRVFPTVEKSLGHCVSYYTYEPYHKNSGDHTYRTREQANSLYLYCGKDVFTMYLVYLAQQELMAKDKGLKDSIDLAQAAILPYLTSSLMGMHYSESEKIAWIQDNDKRMNFYMKLMMKLTGPTVAPLISNQKTVEYFHNQMDYPVVGKTKKGNSSHSADNLYKLALKINNPVMDILIHYREVKKEIGTLNFKPWKV